MSSRRPAAWSRGQPSDVAGRRRPIARIEHGHTGRHAVGQLPQRRTGDHRSRGRPSKPGRRRRSASLKQSKSWQVAALPGAAAERLSHHVASLGIRSRRTPTGLPRGTPAAIASSVSMPSTWASRGVGEHLRRGHADPQAGQGPWPAGHGHQAHLGRGPANLVQAGAGGAPAPCDWAAALPRGLNSTSSNRSRSSTSQPGCRSIRWFLWPDRRTTCTQRSSSATGDTRPAAGTAQPGFIRHISIQPANESAIVQGASRLDRAIP